MDGQKVNDDDRKMFVGGLAQESTDKDLKDYFGKFGEVESVNLKIDQMTGRSRGFAFIVFASADTLDSILTQEHTIKGKKVAVKKAESKQGKIYVGKFQDGITEDDIRNNLSQYGNVVNIQRPVDRSKNNEPKNFCFVTFDKEETANELIKKATISINGQEVEVKRVNNKPDARGGRGGGNQSWGFDPSWGYGGWGYDMAAAGGPWGYGSWGTPGWNPGYGGGGKMAGGPGGFRGRGRGGRSAPY